MNVGIITFPGSNCDYDIQNILCSFFSVKTEMLWYRDSFEQKKFDLLILPGGFSYGDYLRPGAIARFTPAMSSLKEHVRSGRKALGICNGFQILCEAGFLPGALLQNQNLKHICKDTVLNINSQNKFSHLLHDTASLCIPISHSSGNYYATPDQIRKMKDQNQIVFTYKDDNPNGSVADIAGISDKNTRVLGMMPHPERAVDPTTGKEDGKKILTSFLDYCIGDET